MGTTAWFLVFLAQAVLISSGRLHVHRMLGMFGVVAAAGVLVVAAQTDLVATAVAKPLRHPPGAAAERIYFTTNVPFIPAAKCAGKVHRKV